MQSRYQLIEGFGKLGRSGGALKGRKRWGQTKNDEFSQLQRRKKYAQGQVQSRSMYRSMMPFEKLKVANLANMELREPQPRRLKQVFKKYKRSTLHQLRKTPNLLYPTSGPRSIRPRGPPGLGPAQAKSPHPHLTPASMRPTRQQPSALNSQQPLIHRSIKRPINQFKQKQPVKTRKRQLAKDDSHRDGRSVEKSLYVRRRPIYSPAIKSRRSKDIAEPDFDEYSNLKQFVSSA